jgi:polar amino acid transport system permease protein
VGAVVSFDLALLSSFAPAILKATGLTLFIWVVCTVLGLAAGFAVAVARAYGPRLVDRLLFVPVEIIRGTPFLVQVFLLYYGGPYVGLSLDNLPAGIIALSIYSAAYYSEIWRAGFAAIPRGHLEAADCVGMTRTQTLVRIILPEMTMLVLPSMVNMTILMLKETAILSIISVPELTLTVSAIGTQYYAFVESFTVLALIYWALVELCGAAGRAAERRLAKYRFA